MGSFTGNTLKELIIFSAENYSEKTAVRQKINGEYFELSYAQLFNKVKSVSRYLDGLKIGCREKIALLSENSIYWPVIYLGILYGGRTVVPLDTQLKKIEIKNLLSRSKCKVLFISSALNLKLKDMNLNFIKKVEIISLQPDIDYKNEVLELDKPDYTPLFDVDPSDIAALIFTSGTTAEPKGVMLTHKNIVSNIKMTNNIVNFSSKDVFISILPCFHTFEATVGMLIPITAGASITIAGTLKTSDIINRIKETNSTIMIGVPALFEKIMRGILNKVKSADFINRLFFRLMFYYSSFWWRIFKLTSGKKMFKTLRNKGGFGSLRLMVSGGAPLNSKVADFFNQIGITLIQGYGLTETSPILTANRPGNNYSSRTVGAPLPGVEIKIVDAGKDGIGEITVRGENIMPGYYEDIVETEKVLKDGWFHTGDLGRLDKKGNLIITGRLKNMIVRADGKNVYPEEVEDILMESPYISEILVYGRPLSNTSKGEKTEALIFPDYEAVEEYFKIKDIEISDDRIRKLIKQEINRLSEKIAEYKRVYKFRIKKEEFEKTSTRKIKRHLYTAETIE